jgi:hypothetical protein
MCNVNNRMKSRASDEVTSLAESILDFLLDAKRATYASQGDDASVPPLLTGSRQLEYRDGSYFYRVFGLGSNLYSVAMSNTITLLLCVTGW